MCLENVSFLSGYSNNGRHIPQVWLKIHCTSISSYMYHTNTIGMHEIIIICVYMGSFYHINARICIQIGVAYCISLNPCMQCIHTVWYAHYYYNMCVESCCLRSFIALSYSQWSFAWLAMLLRIYMHIYYIYVYYSVQDSLLSCIPLLPFVARWRRYMNNNNENEKKKIEKMGEKKCAVLELYPLAEMIVCLHVFVCVCVWVRYWGCRHVDDRAKHWIWWMARWHNTISYAIHLA